MLRVRLLRWVVRVATYLGVPSDKLLHVVCAMVLMVGISLLTNMCMGYMLTMGICLGKEVWDMYKPNATGFSLGDLMADLLGMIVGMVVMVTII